MILANGCNITKSEKFKGVWILSVPTVYRMDEIKSLSFHIMLYFLFHGVAKYIVYGNTFFIIWMTAIFRRHHGREGETEAGGERPARTKRGARS